MKLNFSLKKILFLFVYGVLILIARYFNITCLWNYLFDIYCPGCGMTRACLSALRLDFKTAFSYHTMFWSVPILLLYFFADGNLFKNKSVNRIVFIIIAIGFLINWVFIPKCNL